MTSRPSSMIRRRDVLAWAAVAVGASILRRPRASWAQALRGEIKVWTFMSAGGTSPREIVFRRLAESFQAANPGVQIVVESQPFQELETKFVTAAAIGRQPDLIWARESFLHFIVDQNGLADLNGLLSDTFKRAALPDMFRVFTDMAVFDGKRVALPIWPTPAQVLFYRRDALRTIGLDAPPLQWEPFVDAAVRLRAGNRWGFGIPTNDNGVSPFLNILAGFGAGIFDPRTGRIDLLSRDARRVAGLIRTMTQRGAIPRDLISMMGDDIQDQFASGRFAIAQAFGPRFSQYQRVAAAYDARELAISPWPSFDGRPPAALLGPYWNVGVAERSRNKEAAVRFLEHLLSPEASLLWAKEGGQVPDRRSVLADAWFEQPAAGPIKDFARIIDGAGSITLPQRMADVTRVFTVLNQAAQQLISTELPVDEVLGAAKRSLGW